MQSNIPTAITFLGVVIAGVAAWVAWAQWYTARTKLAFDLFNQRMEVYDGLISAFSDVVAVGSPVAHTFTNFGRAERKAKFLFGKDVTDYLQTMRSRLATLEECASIMAPNRGDDEYHSAVKRRRVPFDEVVASIVKLPALVAPYMVMDVKMPLTPWAWIKDKISC